MNAASSFDLKGNVGAALYLASSASSYCTGAILRLDGGTQ